LKNVKDESQPVLDEQPGTEPPVPAMIPFIGAANLKGRIVMSGSGVSIGTGPEAT
jgi:hypothetical protein